MQKPLEMLKALIAFGGADVAEERLTDALWPDADGDAAHSSFKFTLHMVRRLIGNENVIKVKEGCVNLDPRFCWVDAWAFEIAAQEADIAFRKSGASKRKPSEDEFAHLATKAMALYRGPFLAGDDRYHWPVSTRERLKGKLIRLVDQVGSHYEKKGWWTKAVECYEKALEAHDLQEEFYQRIMRCYGKMGRRAEALVVYRRCRDILSSVLGIEPSAGTEVLRQKLRG